MLIAARMAELKPLKRLLRYNATPATLPGVSDLSPCCGCGRDLDSAREIPSATDGSVAVHQCCPRTSVESRTGVFLCRSRALHLIPASQYLIPRETQWTARRVKCAQAGENRRMRFRYPFAAAHPPKPTMWHPIRRAAPGLNRRRSTIRWLGFGGRIWGRCPS
jgi:hypothetical protein